MPPPETPSETTAHDELFGNEKFLDSLKESTGKKREDTAQKIRKIIVPKKQGGRPHVSGRETFQSNIKKKGFMFRTIRKKEEEM